MNTITQETGPKMRIAQIQYSYPKEAFRW
uniref:Uncharacterized protein n=1 Tax=Rhizophora mucronata TaxID=61149 RepID=A0A2P2NIT1_RHIMU